MTNQGNIFNYYERTDEDSNYPFVIKLKIYYYYLNTVQISPQFSFKPIFYSQIKNAKVKLVSKNYTIYTVV